MMLIIESTSFIVIALAFNLVKVNHIFQNIKHYLNKVNNQSRGFSHINFIYRNDYNHPHVVIIVIIEFAFANNVNLE
jgi:hypothetical protein